MSDAKRLKSNGAAKTRSSARKNVRIEGHPTPAEVEEEEHAFVALARKHWLKPGKKSTGVKVKNDVIKNAIWDVLEVEHFPHKSLVLLENLQTLESYLWPGYTEESSNYHVLLIALIANVKQREHLSTWTLFEDRPAEFSSLFRRCLSLLLDTTLSPSIRTALLCFLIHAFQSLDSALVRKECAPLVSIAIWHNLSSDKTRESHLDAAPHVKKSWRAAQKRFDAADDAGKARLKFERAWLFTLLLDLLDNLYAENANSEQVVYCERLIEFTTDLLQSLPLRRYVNTLLKDVNLVPAIVLSPMYNDENNALLRDMTTLLSHYINFSIDDQTGLQYDRNMAYDRHCALVGRLQRVALEHFKDKLTVLALSNYGAIADREALEGLLEPLDDTVLSELMRYLDLRQAYPAGSKVPVGREYRMEVLLSLFEKKKTFEDVTENMAMAPTEQTLFDARSQRAESYDGSRPLALPKMNVQYLSVGDFLWRSLVLYRSEAFYSVRKDIEAALRRLKPETGGPNETRFAGFSKMAMPVAKPSVLEVMPALVGSDRPAAVTAEVTYEVRRLGEGVRKEWDSLRPDDVVFLLAIHPGPKHAVSNGGAAQTDAEKFGVLSVRTAVISKITDGKGRPVREGAGGLDFKRHVQLKLDTQSYARDAELTAAGKPDPLEYMNVLLRRNRRENNFKPVLESIRSLILSDVPLPDWLHEVFLGYGDPARATHKQMSNRVRRLDYQDTFLDWQHLIESLPGKIVEPAADASESFGPPYVVEIPESSLEVPVAKTSKKRRRDVEPPLETGIQRLHISSYKPPNTGPYPMDVPRKNHIRFTPAQIQAIMSGSQPGLTVIVGPPGTGKTDVATQIINNIYHAFPRQKTLLLAHSNQALNQLFSKIAALDIDERHLLRLGHGEEDLAVDGSFSKHGRVESFLQNRDRYLAEVHRLAACLGAPGAHHNSAETAGYFRSVYIEPAWSKFLSIADSPEASTADIMEAFPFYAYFSDAPQPLFPLDGAREEILDVAQGCYRHISKIFSELADVVPFEVLRRERDRTNYLLTSEARIIAMTTTHAAIRRSEIAELGFQYDNVVIEEAAQITEIETFLPLAMQKPKDGQMSLQRIVMCGDHFQNSPVIQNLAFRHFANLEQSLFSRLVRLSVPTITLDQQGRARPSLAELYQWRYPGLGSLPSVQENAEFKSANAGFKYDYQLINVPQYKGRGEQEPTPHFIQNLGEAEYAVALFQYMRLLGYPADRISILTTYAGQRALIKDVLSHRCAKHPVFGLPKAVATVDKYQGEQNDYIILSLTRTSRVGYLRDVRRMTVAVSRARLGLYVLGRREVFEACPELRPTVEVLLRRPDKLTLVTGELWPTQRGLLDKDTEVPGEVVMENVEHLGAYVFDMTKTKMKQLGMDGHDQDQQRVQEAEESKEADGQVQESRGEDGESRVDAEPGVPEGQEEV